MSDSTKKPPITMRETQSGLPLDPLYRPEDAREASDPAASGPRLDRGKEQIEAFGGQLVTDELLAIAVGPKDAPAWDHRFRNDFWQGFAPFGL